MNIVYKKKSLTDLKCGDTFYLDGKIFIKTDERSNGGSMIVCVELCDGIIYRFLPLETVLPIPTKVIGGYNEED